MMSGLAAFLYEHRLDSSIDAKPTHVSLIAPKGKFFIDGVDKDTFWHLLDQTDEPLGLAEMPVSPLLPILVDVDLKREVEPRPLVLSDRMLYTIDHVKNVVEIYQKVLREVVRDLDEDHLRCLLLEKRAYLDTSKNKEKHYLKNGFHLHFPYLFLSKSAQENDLYPRIRLEVKKLGEDEFPSVPNRDACIDRAVYKNAWLLYGSQKENSPPYLASLAFDEKARVMEDWEAVFEGYEIFEEDGSRIVFPRHETSRFLPRILSTQVGRRDGYVYSIREDLPTVSLPGARVVRQKKPVVYENMESISPMVDDLLSCWSDERAENRNDWMQAGWILYNVYDGSQEGYDKWVEFSRRSSKFQDSVCAYEWSRMVKKELTIGSLKYIAKEDSPEQYATIMTKYIQPFLDKCLKVEGTHHDLANVLFQRYESEYTCASITHRSWYHFFGHIWQRTEEGNELRKKISTELVGEYENILCNTLVRIQDDDTRQKRLNSASKLIKNLKCSPFKSNIMKEACEIFYDARFLARLDSNPYIIAFSNGVYDIQNHEFRDGRPTDYLSLRMNIAYNPDYTEDCREVGELNQFFEKIFPDRDLREYFLDSAAEIFIGGNFNKVVQIWTGEGDNGKSIMQMLFEQMLGPYSIKLPTSLITGKRTQSSSACPELVRAGNGVRLAMLQEPDKKDCINIGIMKELSGNDTFFARGLYKEGQEITPMFKLVLICNDPPKLPHSDKATWNRLRLIPFESTFTSDAPETYEEQLEAKRFPKDEQFKDKIPKMLEPLAWYLLRRLRFKPKMKKEPLKVVLATSNYQKKNDIYRQFIDETIVAAEGKFLSQFEMYSNFREWLKDSCPNLTVPNRNEVMEYFNRLWGPIDAHRGGWVGWQPRGQAAVMDMSSEPTLQS